MKSLTVKISIIIVAIILTARVYAQIDTSTTQKLLQYIMQPIDKKSDRHGSLM